MKHVNVTLAKCKTSAEPVTLVEPMTSAEQGNVSETNQHQCSEEEQASSV